MKGIIEKAIEAIEDSEESPSSAILYDWTEQELKDVGIKEDFKALK